MTRAELRLDGDRLALRCPECGLDASRPLGPAAGTTFATWADAYRRALPRLDAPDALLALGREIAAWLDGPDGWLARLCEGVRPPLILDVMVPTAEGTALA